MSQPPFDIQATEEDIIPEITPALIDKSQQNFTAMRQNLFLKEQESIYRELLPFVLCSRTTPSLAFQHRLLMNNLDIARIGKDLRTMLMFDWTLQGELSCLLDALFYQYGSEGNLLHDRVRSKITFPVSLTHTQFSDVFSSSLGGTEEIFVIKSNAQRPIYQFYEYIIGKLILNPLRAIVPNFMYTYSYHECGTYYFNDQQALTSWCTNDLPQSGYLYLEKVEGMTLREFVIQYGDAPELLEVLLQIINALYVADLYYSFRHNELTLGNIIVRSLVQPISLALDLFDGRPYLSSLWVPQIIDFGKSSAVYQEVVLQPPMRDAIREPLADVHMLLESISNEIALTHDLTQLMDFITAGTYQSYPEVGVALIELSGYNPLRAEAENYLIPLQIIDNSKRFYKRYFMNYLYHVPEYYDLIDLINEGFGSDEFKQWVIDHLDDSELVIGPAYPIFKEIQRLIKQGAPFTVADDEFDDATLVQALADGLTTVTTFGDYVYILHWYQRIVLPIIKEYQLIETNDENRFVRGVVGASKYYDTQIERCRAFAKRLRDTFYHQGVAVSDYAEVLEKLEVKVRLLVDSSKM